MNPLKIKPNADEQLIRSYVKNDLYRKFRKFFSAVGEKEFSHWGGYSRKAYVSVSPDIEQHIIYFLDNNTDEIMPLIGSTGIGKTHLLLYCLKTYYGKDDIPTNSPVLYNTNSPNGADLLYFNDFNVTDIIALSNSAEFFRAKIQAINSRLMERFGLTAKKIDDMLQRFYLEEKREVLFYEEQQRSFEDDLHRLSVIMNYLNEKERNLNSLVFVFDDIEALPEEKQYELTKFLLVLYENLKSRNTNPLKYNLKFIFCLRHDTYYTFSRTDQYNTYRVNPPVILDLAPSLSALFARRFEVIMETKPPEIGNPITWDRAREILLSICERVDKTYRGLLIKLNNNNVPQALDTFMNIVSNRRWTQQNVNPRASFSIVEEEYYINDANVFRVLCMGEQKVFSYSLENKLRCILPKPGENELSDYYSFLILKAFSYCGGSARTPEITENQLFSKDFFVREFMKFQNAPLLKSRAKTEKEISAIVEKAIRYFRDNRFIKEYIGADSRIHDHYFILPRGELIFTLFFRRIILFTIFRDDFAWDHEKYNIACSYRLDYDVLVLEAIKYNMQLAEIEERFFQSVVSNDEKDSYFNLFGPWSVAQAFSAAINSSVRQFYQYGIPPTISRAYDNLREKLSSIEM